MKPGERGFCPAVRLAQILPNPERRARAVLR